MKRSVIFAALTLIMSVCGLCTTYAQSPVFSIFDSFDEPLMPGQGRVAVHQSEGIKLLVGTRLDSENVDVTNGKTFLKTMGYRIEVYSGNLQQKSRDEAVLLQKQIEEEMPGIGTYLKWEAPIWRLHLGNFRSYEEAMSMVRELRTKYPQKKNEISIVEDEIRLPLD